MRERKQTFVVLNYILSRYELRSSRRIRGRGAEVLGNQSSMFVAEMLNLRKGAKRHSRLWGLFAPSRVCFSKDCTSAAQKVVVGLFSNTQVQRVFGTTLYT